MGCMEIKLEFLERMDLKLDSDFGKLVGISGIVYKLISKISNGAAFYKKLLSITDKSYLASTLSTLFFTCLVQALKILLPHIYENMLVS